MDVAFRAAEAHGIRAILGKVMMDRVTYDPTIEPSTILERSLRESRALAERWHGADDGRLGYAVTPRFAVSCTAELLAASATLARELDCWWQTHVSEDAGEMAEVGPAVSRGARLRRRVRPGGRARAADDPGPRDPSLPAGGGTPRRDRHAAGPLPDVEPLHRRRRDAARVAAGGRPDGGSRVGRVRRPGALAVRRHADRGRFAAGAADAGRGRGRHARARAARLAPARDARRCAGAGPGRRHRVDRGRQGGGPDRGRSRADRAARARSWTMRIASPMPTRW